MKAVELIAELNNLDEHHRVEAKRGSDIDRAFLETVCAFSNEPGLDGGWILLGVTHDDHALFPHYEAVGVSQADLVSQKIATQCASAFNQSIRPFVTSESVNGKTVLVVHVPEADPAAKPVFFQSQGLPKGAFRRIGSTDQRCGDDDLLVFYTQRSGDAFDRAVINDADLKDLDPDAIALYRTARSRVNPMAEELAWSDQELLTALNAAREDGGVLKPTVTGVLLFGTRQAQRRLLPMMRLDYIRVPSNEWVPDPDDRFRTIDMRGPLLSLVQRAQDAVVDDLPRGFVLPEGQVQADTPQLSSRVLREAIVNAVMHRSYQVQSPIQIIRYNNRIEIINPGYSLKAEERLGEPGSETRNPHLAAVFHETNFAETKGSGIRTMRRLMDTSGFAPPTFESDRPGNRFVTRLLLHHFLNPADIRWLARFSNLELTDGQRRALVFLREAGAIDNAVCRQINGVDTLAASQDLRRLRKCGLVEMRGKGSATYYVPTSSFRASLPSGDPGTPLPGEQAPVPVGLVGPSGSSPLGQELGALGQEFGGLGQDLHTLGQDFPPDLLSELRTLGPRAQPDRLRALIRRLCTVRPFHSEELARLIGRDAATLRRKHLAPMVREGILAHIHPDMPNHPRQAYRAAETQK